ncbi:MAG: molybdenum cofactor biosynthesis protein MoaE [Candidatus Bathyarchaeota archaeon]|nr:MAG: molybdenum cofactor biosynthesis protein MoaE [Candidatus Bathyarchaeota archaeon]
MKTTRVGIHEKGEISLIDLIRDVRSSSDVHKAGAIGCFIGIVRGVAKDGGEVKSLEFEAHKKAALRNLSKIASDILNRPGVVDIRIHHNIGELRVGDDIVYIVVAGRHRKDVFQSLEDAIKRLKRETTIWKKEYSTLGEYWVSAADELDGNRNSEEKS